jgi:hypothetical protein
MARIRDEVAEWYAPAKVSLIFTSTNPRIGQSALETVTLHVGGVLRGQVEAFDVLEPRRHRTGSSVPIP